MRTGRLLSERAMTGVWISAFALACAAGGCRDERYFGPYHLEVPTPIMEHSAGRTFQMPLDGSDQREILDLQTCQHDQPTADPPCQCQFPILSVDEQATRVDYRLVHRKGSAANVMIWVGCEAPAGQPSPQELPDLPQIEILAEHLNRMVEGDILDDSFLEPDMRAVDLSWSTERYPTCPGPSGKLPAPTALQVGLSVPADEDAQVSLDVTFRIRETN